MDEFKRLERELVYKGSIIDFYKDTIQVPNGNIVKWDFIGHKGAAAVLPVREDGKILMAPYSIYHVSHPYPFHGV